MEKKVGIWIDHKQAIIVSITGKAIEIKKIESDAGGHYRLSGGSRSSAGYGSQGTVSESKVNRKHEMKLRKYYQKIIQEIQDAYSLYICGPGGAKRELQNEIERDKQVSGKITGIETVDKMTERQVAAHMREFFKVS